MRPVALGRRRRGTPAVPLTPLVDVLLILLFFFMVTSTYLDLDMIPMAEPGAAPSEGGAPRGDAAGGASPAGAAPAGAVLVRLEPGGAAIVAGMRLEGAALTAAMAQRLASRPDAPVLILPSPRASLQALVDLVGAAAAAGAGRVQVIRFEESAP